MDFTNGKTPYDILELASGPAATEAEIRKAYKLLALKKHPDKNKGNPNAAAEFGELEKAYRVLSDASARGALDDYLAAKAQRAQRQSHETDKRRKMREELEKREKEVNTNRNEEQIARVRLQQELERLRQKAEQELQAVRLKAQQQQQEQQQQQGVGSGGGGGPEGAPLDEEAQQQLRCSLKVTWDAGTRDYTPQELRSIFSAHGQVQDVVVRERKPGKGSAGRAGRSSKASALVVMGTPHQADQATMAVNGDVDDPLLVVPLLKVAPSLADAHAAPAPPPSDRGHATRPSPAPSSTTTTFPVAPPPALPHHQMPGIPTGGTGAPTTFTPSLPRTPAAALFPSATASTAKVAFPVAGAAQQQPQSGKGAAPVSVSGFSSFRSFGGGGPGGLGAGGVSFVSQAEADILQKMKRAAEREKQLADARAQEPPE